MALIELGQKKFIGLDIDEGSVVLTELIKKSNQINLAKCAAAKDLKELGANSYFKGQNVIINLPIQVVLFRTFHLAPAFLRSRNKQKDISVFLTHQNLAFKLEDCYWNTFILDSNLNFIAVKKEVAERYIAQVKEAGFSVSAVTPSLIALYNIIVYSYPEKKNDKFLLLNIRFSSSEVLAYQSKRLWAYPLSIGRRDFEQGSEGLERFLAEVQRIINAHFMQNPVTEQKSPNQIFLCGQESSESLVPSLQKAFADYEIITLQPLKNIKALAKSPSVNERALTLSLGLGLTMLNTSGLLNINLIGARVKKERAIAFSDYFKKAFSYIALLAAAFLFILDTNLITALNKEASIYKDTQAKISSVLLEAKALNEEKASVKKLRDFLSSRINLDRTYLRALAFISLAKSPSLTITELDAQAKDNKLNVVLSGSVSNYQEINEFLNKLKKSPDIKEAKVVASTFPSLETETKAIEFKLRFEL